MLKKLLIGSLLIVAAGIGIPSMTWADQTPSSIDVYYVPMHFTFDGKEYAPSDAQKGFIYEDSSYVPLRFISYSLNKAVDWDQDSYTVTVREPKSEELDSINDFKSNAEIREAGTQKMPSGSFEQTRLQAYFETVHYVFDGKVTLPPKEQPGIIMDGTLYVPIRFYSESVGQKIEWDPGTYTVAASTVEKVVDETPTDEGGSDVKKEPAGGNPIPSVPPAGGNLPPVSSGGNSSSSVSQASIEAETQARLETLKSEAQTYFMNLALQYVSEPIRDATVKARYQAEGQAALTNFDGRFDSIIADMAAKLRANGYDSASSEQKFRTEYESQKANARLILDNMIKH